MRALIVVVVAILAAVVPIHAKSSPVAVAAELGAGALSVGLYSCFVVGIFSDVMQIAASLREADASEISLPQLTLLTAGGTALLAAPFVGASAVTAAGKSFGVAAGSAYAFSVVSAYAGGALVFEHEWRGGFPRPDWLPAGLPEWAVVLTAVTAFAAVAGFNLGAIASPLGH